MTLENKIMKHKIKSLIKHIFNYPSINMNNLKFLVVLSSLFILAGCNAEGVFGRIFKNVWGTEKVEPTTFYKPESVEEIIDIIVKAQDEKRRVKMTGSGHSPSDVAVSKDILMYPQNLSGPLKLDNTELKAGARETVTMRSGTKMNTHLVRVKSGTSIRELNTYFDEQGLAFPILGGWDAQTIAGASMTATHGSSLELGSLDSLIESMQVISNDGKLLQIEPTKGITDPKKFKGHLLENPNIPLELIQDDEVFRSMKVSIGSMGIVYAYTLKVFEKFWIKENRVMTNWGEITSHNGFLTNLINGGKLHPDGIEPDFYELQINPYPIETGDYNILLTKRWISTEELTPSQHRAEKGSALLQQLAVTFQDVIEGVVNASPKLAESTLNTALEAQLDEEYINISHKVFNIGAINNTRVYAIEIAFPLNEIVRAIEEQFEIIRELREDNIVQMAPLAIRFVKSSDATISMMHGRDTAMMEIINLQGLRGIEKYFKRHQDRLLDPNEYDSRPHWGLDLNYFKGADSIINCFDVDSVDTGDFYIKLNFERLRTSRKQLAINDNMLKVNARNININENYIQVGDKYLECQDKNRFNPIHYYGDNWNRWLSVYEQFNEFGTFSGKVTDRLGISINR